MPLDNVLLILKRPSRRRVFLTANLKRVELLEGDSSASLFELGFDFLSLVLGNAFLDSLRSVLDNFLGFLEAETGDLADNLDDSYLVVAEALEDDVELGLLLSSSSASSRSSSNGNRSSSGHAKGLLDVLHELGSLEQGHLLQSLNDLFASNSHVSFLSKGPGPSQPNVFVTRRLSGRMS